VTAALAIWIFVLSLAGVSPALHSWLHADASRESHCHSEHEDSSSSSSSDGHYCGVIALQSAMTAVETAVLPERTEYQRIDFQAASIRWLSPYIDQRPRARAPPVEIVV